MFSGAIRRTPKQEIKGFTELKDGKCVIVKGQSRIALSVLHSEIPKLHIILAFLNAMGLRIRFLLLQFSFSFILFLFLFSVKTKITQATRSLCDTTAGYSEPSL